MYVKTVIKEHCFLLMIPGEIKDDIIYSCTQMSLNYILNKTNYVHHFLKIMSQILKRHISDCVDPLP